MAAISQQIEAIPGYDFVVDQWNDYAGQHINTKDPYYIELASGKRKRRKPPESLTPTEKKAWKKVVHSAWFHDRCFLDIWHLDLSLGMCPIVCLLPVIGPAWMWTLHGRILKFSEPLDLPAKLQAKITANIALDLIISLIPVLGSLFAWMNACSTRNAALIDSHLRKRATEHNTTSGGFEVVNETVEENVQLHDMRPPAAVGPQGNQNKTARQTGRGTQAYQASSGGRQAPQASRGVQAPNAHQAPHTPRGGQGFQGPQGPQVPPRAAVTQGGSGGSGYVERSQPTLGYQQSQPQNAHATQQGYYIGTQRTAVSGQAQRTQQRVQDPNRRGPVPQAPGSTRTRPVQIQRRGKDSRVVGAGPQESGYL